MRFSSRIKFILSGCAVIALFIGVLLGLTFGLRAPPLEDGGSPEGPPMVGEPDSTTAPPPVPRPPPSESGDYRFAAVTSDAKLCSTVGTEIMGRKGGSATDAAIATMLCVGVICSHSNGIGGGSFMTIYDTPRGGTEKELTTILFREMAPGAADRDMFVNDTDASRKGGLSIAVPGEVAGMYAAWARFGRVPWADLLSPTHALLRDGFSVERSLASAIRQYGAAIRDDPNLSEIFVNEDGSLKQEGDIIVNTKLAETFRRIAEDPFTFYNGSLAQDIVHDIAEYDGIITEEDLQNYTAKEKSALNVSLSHGDYTVYSTRPPSSGAVLQFILGILDAYELNPDMKDEEMGLMFHRIAEAFKFAYAKRSSLGDEDYWDVDELVLNMTSPDYASYIRSRIDDWRTHNVSYYEPDFELEEDGGTTHVSVVAPDGGAVAMTSTINLFFGSSVRGTRTGIIFNDEMDDFSTPGTSNSFGVPASPSNFIEPGKMPMSSMAPTIITDKQGQPVMLLGAAGGTRITTAIAMVTINNLWFKKKINIALDEPRIHHQLVPNIVSMEPFMDQDIRSSLEERGHEVADYSSIGVVNAIHNSCVECGEEECRDCIHAAADGRKGGGTDGF